MRVLLTVENTMEEIVQVQRKHQITIPKKIREELGIKEGDRLVWIYKNGELILKKGKIIY